MKEKILELERASLALEPSAAERARVRGPVIEYTEHFLDNVASIKAYEFSADQGSGLLDSPISEDGVGIDEAIALIRDNVDTPGLKSASGGHLVDENPSALAAALVDYFQGRLSLAPTGSLVPWSTVADAVEGHLRAAIAAQPPA